MDQEQYSKPLLASSLTIPKSKYRLEFDMQEIVSELKHQLLLAGPFIVVSFLQYSFLLTSLMFIGHLGELALSGASMATSFASVTGFSFMVIKTDGSIWAMFKIFLVAIILNTFCRSIF